MFQVFKNLINCLVIQSTVQRARRACRYVEAMAKVEEMSSSNKCNALMLACDYDGYAQPSISRSPALEFKGSPWSHTSGSDPKALKKKSGSAYNRHTVIAMPQAKEKSWGYKRCTNFLILVSKTAIDGGDIRFIDCYTWLLNLIYKKYSRGVNLIIA